MNVTIPAAVNSQDGILRHTFDQPGLTIVSASAGFFIRFGNGTKQKISTGQQIGSRDGDAIGPVEFSNPTTTAIDVVIGEFDTQVTGVPADLLNVVPVTNITNPFAYTWWDTSEPSAPTPFTPVPLPPNKPFRRCWCYVDQTTFPNDETLFLEFTMRGVVVLDLILHAKSSAGPAAYGMGTVNVMDASVVRSNDANTFWFKTGAGATYYELKPFDLYLLADKVTLTGTSGIGGTSRAFLGVLSTEVKI